MDVTTTRLRELADHAIESLGWLNAAYALRAAADEVERLRLVEQRQLADSVLLREVERVRCMFDPDNLEAYPTLYVNLVRTWTPAMLQMLRRDLTPDAERVPSPVWTEDMVADIKARGERMFDAMMLDEENQRLREAVKALRDASKGVVGALVTAWECNSRAERGQTQQDVADAAVDAALQAKTIWEAALDHPAVKAVSDEAS